MEGLFLSEATREGFLCNAGAMIDELASVNVPLLRSQTNVLLFPFRLKRFVWVF